MLINRRSCFTVSATLALCMPLLMLPASAQDYPTRQVQFVTGSAAGGGGDFQIRLLAEELSKVWGQPVVVENLPGASQSVAAGKVAHSVPDGYTLGFISSSILAIALNPEPGFSLENDLLPVDLVATGPVVMVVNSSVPAKTAQELIDLARAEPGKLNYGSGGVGTTAHLTGELLNKLAGIKMVHVPYAGTARAVTATQSGETQVAFTSLAGNVIPLLESGELRPLAIAGAKPTPLMPSLPTLNETVPGFDMADWYGVFAPKGTPDDILQKLSTDIAKIVTDPEFTKKFAAVGYETQNVTPAEFGTKVHDALQQYSALAKDLGLTW